MLVIVPNSLRDAINAKLDAARDEAAIPPEVWSEIQPNLYHELLGVFDRTGVIPEFSLKKTEPTEEDNADDQ